MKNPLTQDYVFLAIIYFDILKKGHFDKIMRHSLIEAIFYPSLGLQKSCFVWCLFITI